MEQYGGDSVPGKNNRAQSVSVASDTAGAK